MSIPLTTTFTAPASCFSVLDGGFGAYAIASGSSCIPAGAQTTNRAFAFSPAFDCPKSFTTVATTTRSVGDSVETRAVCCPVLDGIPALSAAAFTYNPDTKRHPWFASFGCEVTVNGLNTDLEIRTGSTFQNIAFTAPDFFDAYSVQIAWQASDRTTLASSTRPTSPITSTSAQPAAQTIAAGPTSTTNAPDSSSAVPSEPLISFIPETSSESRSGQMSTTISKVSSTQSARNSSAASSSDANLSISPASGPSSTVKIAIGVIVPVVALAFLALLWFLIRRRRARRQNISLWTGGPEKSWTKNAGVLMEGHT